MATKTRGRRSAAPKTNNQQMNLAVVEPQEVELSDFTYDMVEDEDKKNLLLNYEGEVRSIIRQSLENVVRLGEIFTTIKDQILPYGQWKAWVKYRFNQEIHISTTHNWMNVYQMYTQYAEKYEDALDQIKLRDLYVLGRTGVEADAKETTLELIQEQKVNPKDARRVVETYRKIKLANAGVQPEVIRMLTKVDIAENPKYVHEIQKLSKTKQQEVAQLLMTGEAQSPKEALQVIKENKRAAEEVIEELAEPINTEAVTVEEVVAINPVESYGTLSEVPTETVQIALVESPLKYDFVDSNDFYNLTKEVAATLIPGGFALITVGHKAALYAGSAMHPDLVPIHLVCLRRQPGNTRTIVGLNIASASVYMVLAYKAPYRAPRGFLVADLHTLNDSEALPGMDVVETGLEKSFHHLLEPLLSSQEENGAVLHHIVPGSQHFNVNAFLQETSFELGAQKFISVI